MAWKDNLLGMTIERTMDADFAALKAAGVSFVTIDAGAGWDFNPALQVQLKGAQAAGLPVLLQYTPIPALDDYTFEAPATEQIKALSNVLSGKIFNGLLISMERYWVGYDVEQGRKPPRIATKSAVERAAHELVHGMTKLLAARGVKVMIRSNDNFVTNYGPGIAGWSDGFGFYLADWRYRVRDASGAFSIYNSFPSMTISAISELVAKLPGADTKNPLVPGMAAQLKFWEFTGTVTMPLSLVRGWDGKVLRAKFALFNGGADAMRLYMGAPSSEVPTQPIPVDPPPPVDPDPKPPVSDPVPYEDIEEALARIISLCERMATDVAAIRYIFR